MVFTAQDGQRPLQTSAYSLAGYAHEAAESVLPYRNRWHADPQQAIDYVVRHLFGDRMESVDDSINQMSTLVLYQRLLIPLARLARGHVRVFNTLPDRTQSNDLTRSAIQRYSDLVGSLQHRGQLEPPTDPNVNDFIQLLFDALQAYIAFAPSVPEAHRCSVYPVGSNSFCYDQVGGRFIVSPEGIRKFSEITPMTQEELDAIPLHGASKPPKTVSKVRRGKDGFVVGGRISTNDPSHKVVPKQGKPKRRPAFSGPDLFLDETPRRKAKKKARPKTRPKPKASKRKPSQIRKKKIKPGKPKGRR